MIQADFKADLGSNGNDFAGWIIWDILNGFLRVRVITYEKKGRRPCIKFPGGTMAEGETSILQSAAAELEQETDLTLPQRVIDDATGQTENDFSNVAHVWTNYLAHGHHHQHFFAIEYRHLVGTPRSKEMWDDDEKLGPVEIMLVEEALSVLFPTHRQALEKTIAILGSSLLLEYNHEFRMAARRSQAIARFLPER